MPTTTVVTFSSDIRHVEATVSFTKDATLFAERCFNLFSPWLSSEQLFVDTTMHRCPQSCK